MQYLEATKVVLSLGKLLKEVNGHNIIKIQLNNHSGRYYQHKLVI